MFDEDPPFVAGAFENNFDESLADIKGRFWLVQLKKRLFKKPLQARSIWILLLAPERPKTATMNQLSTSTDGSGTSP